MSIKNKYTVKKINSETVKPFLLQRHYARRLCPMTYCFGLFSGDLIIGICVYGTSANRNNNKWGEYNILQLNRLFIEDGAEKNVLSFFVSQTLKMIPAPVIILSYADPNNGHKGYIYQSTNWMYLGQGARKDGGNDYGITQFIKEGKVYHAKTVSALIGGASKKVAEQNGFERIFLKPLHKYCYLIGNKLDKKNMMNLIKYPIVAYPKGDNTSYDTGSFDEILTLF